MKNNNQTHDNKYKNNWGDEESYKYSGHRKNYFNRFNEKEMNEIVSGGYEREEVGSFETEDNRIMS